MTLDNSRNIKRAIEIVTRKHYSYCKEVSLITTDLWRLKVAYRSVVEGLNSPIDLSDIIIFVMNNMYSGYLCRDFSRKSLKIIKEKVGEILYPLYCCRTKSEYAEKLQDYMANAFKEIYGKFVEFETKLSNLNVANDFVMLSIVNSRKEKNLTKEDFVQLSSQTKFIDARIYNENLLIKILKKDISTAIAKGNYIDGGSAEEEYSDDEYSDDEYSNPRDDENGAY